MSEVRERIFANLRAALAQGGSDVPETGTPTPLSLSRQERIERLKELMERMHTEVHVVKEANWLPMLKNVLRQRSLNGLLYGPGTAPAEVLEQNWESDLPPLVPYTDEVEQIKSKLFGIDAGITTARGGIAETGALILWPDAREPRLLSLVPAVHIAILKADTIYNTFAEAMSGERWQDGMPTNVLLISGPSKTADIELVLTFGVHGPKELIVLIVD
ncbi:MAG: lactate utilization protein [Candidatus Competibacteraceae bacterium]